MTSKSDLATFNCSLARALAVVGDGWSMLILRDAFLARSRFGEFQQGLGVAKNILAERLDRLVEAGALARSEDARPRYLLTDKGRALLPALIALAQWGDEWVSDAAPMIFMNESGRPIDRLALTADGASFDLSGLRVAPGPGADARTKAFLTAQRADEARPLVQAEEPGPGRARRSGKNA